jgi:hypothetical protein
MTEHDFFLPVETSHRSAGVSPHSHIRTVRHAMYVVIVCCEAERSGNADHDTEISTTLRLYASTKLWKAINEVGVLLALLDGKTDIDPESEEFDRLVSAEEVDQP